MNDKFINIFRYKCDGAFGKAVIKFKEVNTLIDKFGLEESNQKIVIKENDDHSFNIRLGDFGDYNLYKSTLYGTECEIDRITINKVSVFKESLRAIGSVLILESFIGHDNIMMIRLDFEYVVLKYREGCRVRWTEGNFPIKIEDI